MQSRLTVGVLVLKPEGLVCGIHYLGFYFQTIPAGVVTEPKQVVFAIGHLTRDADLIEVEVVGLLAAFAVCVDVVLIGETAYVPHVPYVKTEDFVRATVCYNLLTEYFMLEEEIPSSNYYSQLIL